MTAESSAMVAPGEGEIVPQGSVGLVRKISSAAMGGAFSVVEHPVEPGALAAPPHTHTDVDEYSFVIEGEIGVLMGEQTFKAAAGAYVLKPRGVSHTFWNPGPKYLTSPGSWRWPAGTARLSKWSGCLRSQRSTACICGRLQDEGRTGLPYGETIVARRAVDDHRAFAAA